MKLLHAVSLPRQLRSGYASPADRQVVGGQAENRRSGRPSRSGRSPLKNIFGPLTRFAPGRRLSLLNAQKCVRKMGGDMRYSRRGIGLAALIGGAISAPAMAAPARQLVKLEAGQGAQLYGAELKSAG